MKIYVNNVEVKLYLQLEKIYHTKKKKYRPFQIA